MSTALSRHRDIPSSACGSCRPGKERTQERAHSLPYPDFASLDRKGTKKRRSVSDTVDRAICHPVSILISRSIHEDKMR